MTKSTIAIQILTAPQLPTIISDEAVVLGSEASCDYSVNDASVSKRHAQVYRVGDLWWVRDLGTDVGTYLDGDLIDAAPVPGEAILELGTGGIALLLKPCGEAMMRASRVRSEVESDRDDRPDNRKECGLMTAAWSQLGVTAVGLLALVAFPSAIQAGNGLVALTTAAASCPDDSGNIYVDCGNGTVTDNRSGLTWLAKADCGGLMAWHEAMEIVAGLSDLDDDFCADKLLTANECDCGLSDGSSPGDWRLPSIAEWVAMVAEAVVMGCSPAMTNDAGTSCWSACDPRDAFCSSFTNVSSESAWSASTRLDIGGVTSVARIIHLLEGSDDSQLKFIDDTLVLPVRGGQ